MLLFLLVLGPLSVLADQITLKNGDRLTGKIVSRDAEVITLETDYAGVIKISAARVEKVIASDDKAVATKVDAASQTLKSVPADAVRTTAVKAPPSVTRR